MIKFVLILHLCSSISGECFENQTIAEHDDYFSCVKNGYFQSYVSLSSLNVEDINKRKLAIRFECKELKVEKV